MTSVMGFPKAAQQCKQLLCKQLLAMGKTEETWVRPLGREDALEEGMATNSSILAWRIPRTEEPGGLQSMRSQSRTRPKQLSMLSHVYVLGYATRFSAV